MKPFNLQAALNGAALVTRDGRKVLMFALDNETFNGDTFPYMAKIDGDSGFNFFTEDGRYNTIESHLDLFLADVQPEATDLLPKYREMYAILETLLPTLMPAQINQVQQLLLTAKIDGE